ncbi:E3 ubiquitin-protein ligase TRIM38-like [Ctenodactylus gundi]
MAAATITNRIKEFATCSICLNLMTEPVSIDCGHSYCRFCLEQYLYRTKRVHGQMIFSCPLCQAPFNKENFRANKQLEGIIEVIEELEETNDELVCEVHRERLQLFCEDDGQLICWRCERAPPHHGHMVVLVEDVSQSYKEKLEKAVTELSELHTECVNHQALVAMQITQWQDEIQKHRHKIQSNFKNLHTFLHEEEKSHLWKLENEEEQMLRRLRESEANLEQKSDELKSHIQELESKCQSSAETLLQDVRDTLSRSCAVKLEPPEAFSLKIQTECDVPEQYLDVRKMLQRYQVSVTLDPNTAHPHLNVSEDQTQVTRGCGQQNLEVCPRRFTAVPCILGCEGFTSGRHYFEVDVGEGTGWDVGVCMESVQRGKGLKQEPESGFWSLRLCTQQGYVALTSPPTALHLHERPLVVGVFLDYEAGLVSFYNVTTGSHIFTFPKASFSDTLRPYFQVYQHSSLLLLPRAISDTCSGLSKGSEVEESSGTSQGSNTAKGSRGQDDLILSAAPQGYRRPFLDPNSKEEKGLKLPKRQRTLSDVLALPCPKSALSILQTSKPLKQEEPNAQQTACCMQLQSD